MKNIWHLFTSDLKRLTSNVVTGVIVLGLIFLPSIFSWYNIIACWDVFNSTGNLKVAVANTDEGYKSDLVPLEINIGEQVTSALRENDQLNWVFTTEDDAIDGAQSGKYYAAVVIPSSFSKDMMTFYSDEVEHAHIVYYTNEKKSAVAPKVTGQGADQVSYQVNEVFTETLSEAALGISSALTQYADDADLNGQIGVLANHVSTMGVQMSQAASMLTAYSSILATSQNLVSGSSDLLAQAKDASGEVGDAAEQGQQAVSTIADALSASSDALSAALAGSSEGYAGMADSIDAAFESSDTLASDSAGQLRDCASAAGDNITHYQALASQLEQLKNQIEDQYKPVLETLISQLNSSIEQQEKLRDGLYQAADNLESGNATAQAQHEEIRQLTTQAQNSVDGLTAHYDTDIKPGMDELQSGVAALVSSLSGSAQKLDSTSGDLSGTSESISDQLRDAKNKLDAAANDLNLSSEKLGSLSKAMLEALSSGDVEALRTLLGSDPSALAAALAAPVQLDRQAVFPADNFGSQMAPLYTTLALWIGSLLLAVAVRVVVSDKAQRGLDHPQLHQLFLGRFGVFALLSLMQTTCMAVGNMLFLNVQVNEPILYLLCFWIAGLVFTFIIYSLVVSFANLGKALAVLLLIIQVTGGGGSFPLQVLPEFFQVVSPYLPATHVINAMRAAMMGVYQNDFWIEIGLLLLFLIPAALLGLVLRKPLMSFLNWYVRKVEASRLVA